MLNAEGRGLQTSPTEALRLKHTGNLFMPVPDSATRGKQRIVSVLDEKPQMQPDPASRTPGMAGACSTSVGQRDLMETSTGGSAAAPQERATCRPRAAHTCGTRFHSRGPVHRGAGCRRGCLLAPARRAGRRAPGDAVSEPRARRSADCTHCPCSARHREAFHKPSLAERLSQHWFSRTRSSRGSELASLCSPSPSQGAAVR